MTHRVGDGLTFAAVVITAVWTFDHRDIGKVAFEPRSSDVVEDTLV